MENKTRAFICIDFPEEVIKEIARIQTLIEKQHITGKLTEPENLHLTLKFLGEVNEVTLLKVKEALSKIEYPLLNLRLGKVGTFSYGKNPKIAWISIFGNIFGLQKEIDKSLSDLFPKEERFMSHLTIARIRHVSDREGFKTYMSKIKPKQIDFSIDNFELKSSELKPLGPIYKIIQEFKLRRLANFSTNFFNF